MTAELQAFLVDLVVRLAQDRATSEEVDAVRSFYMLERIRRVRAGHSDDADSPSALEKDAMKYFTLGWYLYEVVGLEGQ